MKAAAPHPDTPIPLIVRSLAAGRALRPIWRNQLGGLTFAVLDEDGSPERYVKWQPHGTDVDLAREAEKLAWVGRFLPVPVIVDRGRDDEAAWTVTMALGGVSAVDARWLADPSTAVWAIGVGLRRFHDTLPVGACPFSWSIESRIAGFPETRAALSDGSIAVPTVDRLVVCHGDACAPNTLVGPTGEWVGHVDMGSAGVGDRWGDLAVASMSLGWNYGEGWEARFFEAYGIAPDPERIAFYRWLWDHT